MCIFTHVCAWVSVHFSVHVFMCICVWVDARVGRLLLVVWVCVCGGGGGGVRAWGVWQDG